MCLPHLQSAAQDAALRSAGVRAKVSAQRRGCAPPPHKPGGRASPLPVGACVRLHQQHAQLPLQSAPPLARPRPAWAAPASFALQRPWAPKKGWSGEFSFGGASRPYQTDAGPCVLPEKRYGVWRSKYLMYMRSLTRCVWGGSVPLQAQQRLTPCDLGCTTGQSAGGGLQVPQSPGTNASLQRAGRGWTVACSSQRHHVADCIFRSSACRTCLRAAHAAGGKWRSTHVPLARRRICGCAG